VSAIAPEWFAQFKDRYVSTCLVRMTDPTCVAVRSAYEISIISVSFLLAIAVAVYTVVLGRLLYQRKHRLSRILVVISCSSTVCLACLFREILQVSVVAKAGFIANLGSLAFNVMLYVIPDILVVVSITVMVLSAAWSAEQVTEEMLLRPLLSNRGDRIPPAYEV
jgi:hypothetical protein